MIWGGLPPHAGSALSTSNAAATAARFISSAYRLDRAAKDAPLKVGLEPGPHLLRKLLES